MSGWSELLIGFILVLVGIQAPQALAVSDSGRGAGCVEAAVSSSAGNEAYLVSTHEPKKVYATVKMGLKSGTVGKLCFSSVDDDGVANAATFQVTQTPKVHPQPKEAPKQQWIPPRKPVKYIKLR